jgi:hypothetical protein
MDDRSFSDAAPEGGDPESNVRMLKASAER